MMSDNDYWIGAYDSGSNGYKWIGIKDWYRLSEWEPNVGQDDCVLLQKTNGTFNNSNCFTKKFFICGVDPVKV